ncbi:MAG: CBS domain-containing protein [Candidatus Aenigmarchaeota archaeon]|nr:CBS domain-containing protein [Candidatus Aenigmarchaeota archaeon]
MKSIEDIMTKNIITIDSKANVVDAAKKLEKNKEVCLIVKEGKETVGIVTERDIVYKYLAKKNNLQVKDIMSRPIIDLSLEKNKNIMDAILIMHKNKIKKLAIKKNGKIVGILCEGFLPKFCIDTVKKPSQYN